MSEEKSTSCVDRNVGMIALIVAIIALFGTLIPQICDFVKTGSPAQAVEGNAAPGPGGPGMGPGGPGMGPGGPGMGPGGPGAGRPGMGPGAGGMRGGRGFMAPPSEEFIAKYKERVALLDDALKANGSDLKLRLDRDLAALMLIRYQAGGRMVAAGLAEAFLKKCYAVNAGNVSALDKNQAELDYIQALDRMRGDKEAFLNTVKAFGEYPKKALNDAELQAIFTAELPPAQ